MAGFQEQLFVIAHYPLSTVVASPGDENNHTHDA